jgi:hypothetical protein
MDLSAVAWRKSSRSSGGGNACVEVAAVPDTAAWRKSSRSSGGGNECVEVAAHRSSIAIRDSKHPEGPALLLDLGSFRDLTARIKNDDHHS